MSINKYVINDHSTIMFKILVISRITYQYEVRAHIQRNEFKMLA